MIIGLGWVLFLVCGLSVLWISLLDSILSLRYLEVR